MDELPEKLNRYHWLSLLIISILIILNGWKFHINCPIIFKGNNVIIAGTIASLFGVVAIIGIRIFDYCQEKKFEKIIRKRLEYELETNLEVINDNIYIIKHSLLPFEELGLIENIILTSLINTLKVAIIPKGAVDYILIFKTATENINNAIKNRNLKSALKESLIARLALIESFKYLGLEQQYSKYLLKGINYQLTPEDIT